jgi:N6-L-threonylcarbamoyladenine synthase
LRQTLEEECAKLNVKLVIPPPDLCTDNAAMIGAAAPYTPAFAYPNYLSLNARSV